MKLSAEFLDNLPSLPTDDFNEVNQCGFFRVAGRYFNGPTIGEVDGVLFSTKVGDMGNQKLFLVGGEYGYEREVHRNWVRKNCLDM